MGYNFILPTHCSDCLPPNTVGLYLKVLLEQCSSMSFTVAFNGSQVNSPYVMCPRTQSEFTPRRLPIPELLLSVLRDLRLSRPFEIPVSYFKEDYINIVFIGHQIVLPKLSNKYQLVGLLDEPPSLGDNFKIQFISHFVERRFRKQLFKIDKFWVYHKAGADYLKAVGIQSPVFTFPCVLDYSMISTSRKAIQLHSPIRIVMASTYLPWHQTSAMLLSLKELLDKKLIHITLIGNGPARAETEKSAKGIPEITFLDGMNYEDYKTCLKNFDFGILWKIPWFNSPLKLMDYARAQLGIITFETPAIRSIFPENTYYTIDEFLGILQKKEGFSDFESRVQNMNSFINEELNHQKLTAHFKLLQP
jgi:hypothetical protein